MSLSASTFDPSASTMSRASISASAAAHSLADQLPGVHFGFDELRDRMARFTARFDAFNSEGRKRVYEQREQFKLAMGELEGEWGGLVSFIPPQ
jgi:kinetochore protein Spc25